MILEEMRRELRERFERLKRGNPSLSPHVPRSLREQMTEENLIKRIDLWNFVQAHKGRPKDEFGGWLLGQEIRRTDKIIMAVDLWNDVVGQKLVRER